MPLPMAIHYVDAEHNIREDVAVKTGKPSGYEPTPEYHPTMVMVRCLGCKSVGVAEFVNGFNLKDGDALMAGRPIRGTCLRCQKDQELVPIKLSGPEEKELRLLYGVRKSLEEAVRRGERLGPSGLIWPVERIKLYERWRDEAAGSA